VAASGATSGRQAGDIDGFGAGVARMPADGWDRTCTRLPHEQRTARWLVRQALHEGVHHLLDVETVAARCGNSRCSPVDVVIPRSIDCTATHTAEVRHP
jgi:hypothetical protein